MADTSKILRAILLVGGLAAIGYGAYSLLKRLQTQGTAGQTGGGTSQQGGTTGGSTPPWTPPPSQPTPPTPPPSPPTPPPSPPSPEVTVLGVTANPNTFQTQTTFIVQIIPAGTVADKITIAIYDLLGMKVAELTGTNTTTVTWNPGNLRNGAYIYKATVQCAGKTWGPFQGFVYLER